MFKAKHKTVSLFAACLTLLFAFVIGFAALFAPTPVTTAKAKEVSYSYTFSATQFSANGTKTLNDVAWTLAGNGGYWGYDGTKGQQFGSGSSPYKSLTLTSTKFNNVSKIVINTSGASKISGTFTVSVGDTQVGNKTTLTTSATSYTFNSATPLTGAVKFSYTQTSSKAIYIKSITVTYEEANTCAHEGEKTWKVSATEHYQLCNVCNEEINDTRSAHDFDEGVVTEPTTETEGYTTYTCATCNYTYNDDFKPALNATEYTVSFSVPQGITAVESKTVAEGFPIELPTADNNSLYTFYGWTTDEYADNTTLPTNVYKAGDEFIVNEDSTLYALYTYGTGSGKWKKVTSTPSDWSGEYLIVYEASNNAYIFNALDAVNGYLSATTDGTYIATSDAIKAEAVTVAKMTDGYSILTKNGYIYGDSGSNKLSFDKTTAKLNTIALANDGSATITSGRVLRFNNASNQMRFRYYSSGTQQKIYLYAMDGISYYTTSLSNTIDSATVTVGADLKLNYKATLSDAFASAKMHFTFDNETYDVAGVKQADGRYAYSLAIPPQAMAVNVKAELKFGDILLDSMDNYSIQTYAQNKLNDSDSSAELKQLLTDMLYYGDAAYNYVNETTGETPITDGVENLGTPSTAEPVEPEFTAAPVNNTEVKSYPVYFTNAKVWFGDVNKIYIQVNAIEGATLSVNGGEAVALTSHTIEKVLLATEFDEEFTFALYYEGVLMQTLTYSVNAYAYKMKDHATMGDLAKALYNYGKSAEAYIN